MRIRPTVFAAMPAPDKVPKSIVFITIDRMREDYLDRFQLQLTGGLARLSRDGPTLAWIAATPPTDKLDGVMLWQSIR